MKTTRNSTVLEDFIDYCEKHPEERFWQALRNWSGFTRVSVMKTTKIDDYIQNTDTKEMIHINEDVQLLDTFYWEEKDR